MKKRVVSLLLCLIMALSLIPTTAFAVGTSSQDDGISLTSIVQPDDQSYYTYEFYLSRDSREPYSTQIVKEGEKLYQPETPTTPEGKVFTGWYDEAGNPFTGFGEIDEIKSNEIIKLYARIEDGYYVFFMNGDTVIATETGQTGAEISLNSVSFPVEADQAITGWYKDGSLTESASNPVIIGTSNISLYAKVETGHWITFDSDGGSYVEPKFFATSKNTEKPNDPAKPGYAFAGWNTENGTAYTFGSPLTESITLKAKWTAKDGVKYTVIHWQENANDDEYSFAESEQLTGTPGQLTEDAVDKSYEGFTLNKDKTDAQKTIAGDGSTIVNVYYKRNVYKVTFASNSDQGDDLLCGKVEHSHTYTDRKPTWGGWKYTGGCYRADSYSRNPICGIDEHDHTHGNLFQSSCYGTIYKELTIEAKYGAYIGNKWPTYNGSNTWAVERNGDTYQANINTMPLGGATFYGPETGKNTETAYYYVEVLPGESGTLDQGKYYKRHHSDTSVGKGFLVTDEDKYPITGFTYDHGTKNQSSYNNAKFYYTRNSYKIVFMNNGQEKTVSRKYEQSIANDSYTPTAPEGKEGYKFAGWYDNELCEGKEYTFTGKTMPAQNITLYAKWVAPVHTVTVYDSNRTTVLNTLKKAHKSTIDMNKEMPKYTAPEGYEFLGWVLLEDGTEDGTPFNFNTEITRDYELYAKIGSMATYTVTYDKNGGSGTMADTAKYAEGATASVMKNTFTAPSGQVFLGWSTTANGPVEYYANSQLKIEKQNVTLYAIWGGKDSTVTLTYKANYEGADPAMSEVPSLKNNALVKLAAANLFTRPDYEFTGWNTQADGKGTSFAAGSNARVDDVDEDENVLYAQWKQLTGSLTITKVVSAPEGVTVPDSFTFNVSGYSEPVTVTAVDNWTKTITVNAGTYTVTENTSTVPGGYKLDTTYAPENRTVTVNAGAIANVTVTNTYTKVFGADIVNPASLTVFKKDARTDALLSGAEFQLLKKVGNDYVAVGIPVGTTSSGMITFTALEPGDYQLKETKAPANYVGWTDHTFAFTVVKNDEPTDAARYNETTKQFEKVYDCHIVLTSDLDEGFQDFYKNYSFANNELTVYNEKIGGKEIEVKKIVKAPYAPVGETEFTFYVTLGYDNNTSVFEDVELLSDFHIYFKAKGADTAKELTLDDMENRYSFTMKASSDKIGEGTLILTGTQNDLDRLAVSVWEDGDEAPENWEYADEPCVAILTYDKESNDYLLLNEDEEPVTVPFTFTNTYTKVVTDVTAKFNVEKLVERQRGSRKPGKADFTFEAYYTNNEGKLVKIDQNLTISTNGVDKYTSSWNLVVPAAAFNDNGVASLTIKEVNSRKTGWTYDKTEYKLVVTQDGKVDRLANPLAAVEVDPDAALTLSFINTYYKRSGGGGGGDKPIQSVKTGDMGIAMYAMTSLLSLGGAALVIKKRKEEK